MASNGHTKKLETLYYFTTASEGVKKRLTTELPIPQMPRTSETGKTADPDSPLMRYALIEIMICDCDRR